MKRHAQFLHPLAHFSAFLLPLLLFGASLAKRDWVEPLFIHTTYYFLFMLFLVWLGIHLHALRAHAWPSLKSYLLDNLAGFLIAGAVGLITLLSVEPALRILADETNLLGTSKNLFFAQKATFALTGKWYYDNFQELSWVIDRRPALFPFLVNLLHSLLGYSHQNPFHLNAVFLPIFVFTAYRLARSLAGQTFAMASALLVAAHPILLMSVRSGGFDFIATTFSLLVLKAFYDHARNPSPLRLAMVWMNLCMFVEIRYESGLFFFPVAGLLLLFGLLRWEYLRPYLFVYALTPSYFLPRVWQGVLRGHVPEQDPGTIPFSGHNFLVNARDYFKVLTTPFDLAQPYGAILIALGIAGGLLWLQWLWQHARPILQPKAETQWAILVTVWMVGQSVILFAYVWGRPLHPASARLLLPMHVFFSFGAAWFLATAMKSLPRLVPSLLCGALFLFSVPAAAEGRFLNQLTLIRQASAQWKFFKNLQDRRILVVTDRPGLFTVMNYGAMDIQTARQNQDLLHELSRHLFNDIYVIQDVDLATNQPKPEFEIWPDKAKVTMLEFQNDAGTSVRISKMVH